METTGNRPGKLLYDATEYFDILPNRSPQNGEPMLRAAEAGIRLGPKRNWRQQSVDLILLASKHANSQYRLRV
jgi:hypothetical protein